MYLRVFVISILQFFIRYLFALSCRDRSIYLRQDGELCFEIPPWQHQPVKLIEHVTRIKEMWVGNETRRSLNVRPLGNSEITRYMDTVIAPFLDTYHSNIQNSYQQLTSKILLEIKEEINTAVKKKESIYKELIDLANKLEIPDTCDEERRNARRVASHHVAKIYECTETARTSIAKMGKYAETMIGITRTHMQTTLNEAIRPLDVNNEGSKVFSKTDVTKTLQRLSKAAVVLGYELDLSLTNARRHNEQSCERLTTCSSKAHKSTEGTIHQLKEQMYQCVYA